MEPIDLEKLLDSAQNTEKAVKNIDYTLDKSDDKLGEILIEMKKQTKILNQILEEILKRD